MKTVRTAALASFLLFSHAFAVAPDSTQVIVPAPVAQPLGIELGAGYDSSYVFKGREIDRNLISGSLDFKHALNDILSFRGGAWYGDTRSRGGISELDLAAGLSANLGFVELGLGYRWYHVFDAPSRTAGKILAGDINEAGITIATSAGPLDLTFSAFYDDRTRGTYYDLAVTAEYKISDRINLVPGVSVGFNGGYYDVSGFSHVKPGISMPIKIAKNITLTPYIAGNVVFNDLKSLGERSRAYGGVKFSVEF